MIEELLLTGFGGQGILSSGMLLAYAATAEDLHVTWMPAYGPEMRGGAAHCGVVISDMPISSPLVTEPTTLIAANRISLAKFIGAVQPGGLVIYNSSLIKEVPKREDVRLFPVRANQVAEMIGNNRVAVNVMLGAFVVLRKVTSVARLVAVLDKVLPSHRHHLIPANQRAIKEGARLAQSHHTDGGAA